MKAVLALFLATAVALAASACGGSTAAGDAGLDAASDGPDTVGPDATTGCTVSTSTFAVDASVCAPQLASAASCQGAVCRWTVDVPCFDDAGGSDAGDAGGADAAGDAGNGTDCSAWCAAVAPPNVSPGAVFCQQTSAADGGVVVLCGGCGA